MTGMNETEATAYVATLTDTVPAAPAPIVDLLAAGVSARRRHRRRAVAGAVAAVLVVVGGMGVTVGALSGPESTGLAPSDARTSTVDLDPGTVVVDAGAVTFELPDYWRILPQSCRRDGESVVAVPSGDCNDAPPGGLATTALEPSLVVAPLDTVTGRAVAGRIDIARGSRLTLLTVHGVAVRLQNHGCGTLMADSVGADPDLAVSFCSSDLVLPDAGIAVHIAAPVQRIVDRIVASIRSTADPAPAQGAN